MIASVKGPRLEAAGVARPDTLVVSLAHDFDPDLEERWYEFPLDLDPKTRRSSLLVKSHVYATQSKKKLGSANYLAAVRRREAGLSPSSSRISPPAATTSISLRGRTRLEKLRRAVQVLADAEESAYPEHEGNACEILREVRDSFLNGGWRKYRERGVPETVAGILVKCAGRRG